MRSPYTPVRVTPPAEMPVTLARAKAHLRVDTSDEDTLITGLIAAATSYLDGWSGVLGRCLVTQTWQQTFDRFGDRLDLPFPGAAVTGITYLDAAGSTQTLATSVYAVREDGGGSYAERKRGQSWPSTADVSEAVTVTFTTGYGAADDVPPAIVAALLLMVGHLYENREAAMAGAQASEVPLAFSALIAPFRRVGI